MKKSFSIIVYNVFFILFACGSSHFVRAKGVDHAKILVLGDSISAGYGLANGTGWVSLLQKDLTKIDPSIVVQNASISGDTTAGGKQRLPDLLTKYKPDILIIELGGNDALRGFPLNRSQQNLEDMVHMAQDVHSRVVILGMRVPSNYGKDYTNAFFQMFSTVAKSTHSTLVPFLLEGMATQRELFQEDGIHPNEQAQVILKNNVAPVLKSLLR
jgi:acyl-CoA thioesterase-1